MITSRQATPSSRQLKAERLMELADELIGDSDMRYGILHSHPYWNCTISRRARGVFDVQCIWGEKETTYYGSERALKRLIRAHIKAHDVDREAPCRLAEDLR